MKSNTMAEEILNIEYHKRRLLLKALNKFRIPQACLYLGISERTLWKMKKQYGITRIDGVYQVSDEKKLQVVIIKSL